MMSFLLSIKVCSMANTSFEVANFFIKAVFSFASNVGSSPLYAIISNTPKRISCLSGSPIAAATSRLLEDLPFLKTQISPANITSSLMDLAAVVMAFISFGLPFRSNNVALPFLISKAAK